MVLKFMDKIGNSHVGFFYFSYSIHYFFLKKIKIFIFIYKAPSSRIFIVQLLFTIQQNNIYIYIYIYILNDKILNVTHVCVYYVNIEKKIYIILD